MPQYPYECQDCAHDFEITKSVKHIEDLEHCPKCSGVAERYISNKISFSGASDWDTAHYSPALGKVVKSNAEARREARRMGLEEVGSEPVENIHKHFDAQRENKRKAVYDDLFTANLGEINSK